MSTIAIKDLRYSRHLPANVESLDAIAASDVYFKLLKRTKPNVALHTLVGILVVALSIAGWFLGSFLAQGHHVTLWASLVSTALGLSPLLILVELWDNDPLLIAVVRALRSLGDDIEVVDLVPGATKPVRGADLDTVIESHEPGSILKVETKEAVTQAYLSAVTWYADNVVGSKSPEPAAEIVRVRDSLRDDISCLLCPDPKLGVVGHTLARAAVVATVIVGWLRTK